MITDEQFAAWLDDPQSRPVYLAELTYRRPQWGLEVSALKFLSGVSHGDVRSVTALGYFQLPTAGIAYTDFFRFDCSGGRDIRVSADASGGLSVTVKDGITSTSGPLGVSVTHGVPVWLTLVVNWDQGVASAYVDGVSAPSTIDISSLVAWSGTASSVAIWYNGYSATFYAYRAYAWHGILVSAAAAAALPDVPPNDQRPMVRWRGRDAGVASYDADTWDSINGLVVPATGSVGGTYLETRPSMAGGGTSIEAPDYGDATVYLATSAYQNSPTDSGTLAPVNQPYDERLIRPPTLDWRVSDGLFGVASESIGAIELDNNDGALTDAALEDWLGGKAVVSIGDLRWERDDFRPWCSGVVESARLDSNTVSLSVAGNTLRLDVGISGDSIEDGPQRGQKKPVIFGIIDNAKPVLKDGTLHEYIFSWGGLSAGVDSLDEIRDSGVPASATTTPPGTVTLSSKPVGDVSFSARSYNYSPYIRDLIVEFTDLVAADFETLPSPGRIDSGNGAAVWSIYITETARLLDILRATAEVTGTVYYTRPSGKIRAQALNAPARTHVLGADLVLSAGTTNTIYPKIAPTVNHFPNHHPQQALASSLTEDERERWSRAGMSLSFDDDTAADAWPRIGKSAPIDSPVTRDAYYSDKSTEVGIWGHPADVFTKYRQMVPTMRHIWRVKLNRPRPLIELTDAAWFYHPVTAKAWRYGHVVGVSHEAGATSLDVLV